MSIRFGYACLALGVPETELRSCILRTATPEKLREITAHNLRSLERLIDYNARNGITVFRISSDLIPFGSSPVNTIHWQEEYEQTFQRIGERISSAGMRVSMHPGQYTVLNSPSEDVVQRAIADLDYHEQVLRLLGTDVSSKIILHVGGVYGDRDAAMERFLQNWTSLRPAVKERIVLENDERSYHVEQVLHLAEKIGVPVVFDTLHHTIHQPEERESLRFWIERCAQTWNQSDGPQKIHYSQQESGGRVGAHSQTIRQSEFLELYEGISDLELDMMLEVKDKNISAMKCMLMTKDDCSVSMLEQEWARYKYPVLEHSHQDYLTIQELLKDKKTHSATKFYQITEHALSLPVQPGDALNAAMHVWGYFKGIANESEKKKTMTMMQRYSRGEITVQSMKNQLYRLAQTYKQTYLLESYYFL